MNVGTKILLATMGAVLAASVTALLVMRTVISDQGADLIRNEMHALVVEGESVRESISALRKDRAFDDDYLLEELQEHDDYHDAAIYNTIPVVAAWNAIGEAAEHSGYEFRVVRENPRNPHNAPTPYERGLVEEVEATAGEVFRVDRDEGVIVFARPIVMTQDCLTCHGDCRQGTNRAVSTHSVVRPRSHWP